jgi:hypothetical protein
MSQISEAEFVERAIKKLRMEGRNGIHTVYSGLNRAFAEHFKKDPVKSINNMIAQGKFAGHPTKGGFTLYLPGEGPKNTAADTLAKILAED